MSKFGWSLPAGCGMTPGEEPEPPVALRCPKCGRFVKMEPTWEEPYEDSYINDDPHFGPVGKKIIMWTGVILHYECTRCGDVKEPLPVFAR